MGAQQVTTNGFGWRMRGFAAAVCAVGFLFLGATWSPAARADIPYPYEFMPQIDGYAPYSPPNLCSQSAKPGPLKLRDLLNFWFGHHNSGIVRDCSIGKPSDHHAGRALDYHVDARYDPATTMRIIDWVLRSDQYGNRHAFGRRFGLMYIISNRQIFRFYRPGEGWRPYDCSDVTSCHIDHIHFSFHPHGAAALSSWYTTTQHLRTGCSSRVRFWSYSSAFGPLYQIKAIRDGYGNLFDTQREIRNSYWRVRAGGTIYRANQPVSPFANPGPQAIFPTTLGACYINM